MLLLHKEIQNVQNGGIQLVYTLRIEYTDLIYDYDELYMISTILYTIGKLFVRFMSSQCVTSPHIDPSALMVYFPIETLYCTRI